MALQLRQIKNELEKTLTDKIDTSDMNGKSEDDLKKIRLSRSYAVYSLINLAFVKDDIAIDALVDSYNDNGLDLIYYEENENILWLVQSKWIEKGRGEPATGEVHKFIQGIEDLLDLKFSNFNSKVNEKKLEIEKALDNPNLKIKIVLAYSGTKLSTNQNNIIQEFIKDNNEVSELCFFEIFSLSEAHKALSGSLHKKIDGDIYLTNWNLNEEPYKTLYGQISAENLANLWKESQENLFAKNIRSFVGLTDVNDGIKNTLLDNPESFLYFNNGITILCDKMNKKPVGGSDKSMGVFYCEGISVVNGAQTVGTIGNSYKLHSEQVKKAKVFIKVISLENCPSNFAFEVTKAANTQNKVENRDFISLDDLQSQLQINLKLMGIDYHYKRDSSQYKLDNNNCTLEEATRALACEKEDIRYALMAKDKIGKLWENVDKPPYTDIFNDRIKAEKVWRMICILRVVNQNLSSLTSENTGRKRSIYIYGKSFILHMVLKYVKKQIDLDENSFQMFLKDNLSQKIDNIIQNTVDVVENNFADKMVHSTFRKLENYRILSQETLKLSPMSN